MEKIYKILFTVIGVAIVALLVNLGWAKYVGATEVQPKCWEEPVDEPVDTCDSEEGIQENGCTPVEEEEPPVIVPGTPKVSTPDAPKVRYSQGPHGVKGDGKCQLEHHTIKGSKRIEVRYAEDRVFGNGYKSFQTVDDGAIDLKLEGDSAAVKIRGRDSKGPWSSVKLVKC